MRSRLRWVEWHDPDPVVLSALIGACDRSFGHVPIEVTAEELAGFMQPGAAIRLIRGSETVGAATAIPDDVALVGVPRSLAERDRVLAEVMSWFAGRLGVGALWLPDGDEAAELVAANAGFVLQYTDIQMTLPVTTVQAPGAPPPGYEPVTLGTDRASGLDAVHDLVCRAWSVAPHRAAFQGRFAALTADPSLWVLLRSSSGTSAGRLAAAAWGSIQTSGSTRVGQVGHLNVDPEHRRRGLGPWTLAELVRRFEVADPRVSMAQLGVHGDNASHAPDLYRRLGWTEVSRHQKWARRDERATDP